MPTKTWFRWLVPAVLIAVLLAAGWSAGWFSSANSLVTDTAYSPASASQARPDEPVGPLPNPPALDPRVVALGRSLFHDTRLSGDNTVSCASCHALDRGGVDGLPRSLGVGGALGGINAPSVLTAAYNFRQFWDGRAGTLEEQAGGPVLNPLEMAATWPLVLGRLNQDARLKREFEQIYPSGLTQENILSAIADFERSLPQASRFDRWLKGEDNAVTAVELEGYRLFKRHGCAACHQGVNVGGNLYQRFGVMDDYFATKKKLTDADRGRFNVTHKEEDRHLFKVPSLRNVELTAPYFHDASANTLEEAVSIMGRYQLGVDLPGKDILAIAAFLKTLTAEASQ